MKRPSHTTPSPDPVSSTPSPNTSPNDCPTPSKKARKVQAKPENGSWTPEKKMILLDEIFSAGMVALDRAELCAKLGITSSQLHNQTSKGNPTNFRAQVLRLVGEKAKGK